MKLLIVDDHEVNLRLLRAQMEGEGHAVREAHDGLEALCILEHEPTDAVISDVFMPRMDGFRLCRQVRQHERLSLLPFILYSSTCTAPEDAELGLSVGADCFILRPAPVADLSRALEAAVAAPPESRHTSCEFDRELDLLQHYSQGLVAKLEEKSTALVRAIAERDKEISQRRMAQDALRQLNTLLEDRVRERTAQLEVSNRDLEAFSYSISHDLRAPIRAIDSYASILSREHATELDNEALRLLSVVTSEAKRMGSLMDALLSYSRIGRENLPIAEVDMTGEAEAAFAEAILDAGDRLIDFELSVLPVACGEPLLIRQVWANLLSNAVKFTGHRSDARIEAGATIIDGITTYFVRDNGAGFDMAHAAKLFRVFERLHSEEEFPGTGVGLAFAKRIIERHGGRIWAESAPGNGATFYFTLERRLNGGSGAA